MPLLTVNLQTEMLYIIEQRLKAQVVKEEKAQKVLSDIVSAMFDTKVVDELFKPQEMHTPAMVKGYIDRLVHSSVMKLNESSLSMLFDLVLMTVKWQLFSCTYPEQFLAVTTNHLNAVKKMIVDRNLISAVDQFASRIDAKYSKMCNGELHLIWRTLFRFFQDRRVHVSLFLNRGYQLKNGTLVRPTKEQPGTIRYLAPNGSISSEDRFNYPVEHAVRTQYTPPVDLGKNVYLAAETVTKPTTMKVQPTAPPAERSESSKQELSLLAHLIRPLSQTSGETFRLNMFDAGFIEDGSRWQVDTITIDATKKESSRLDDIMKDLDMDDEDGDDSVFDLVS
ncbi:hypothetical protein PROFUN_01898 [Planoprotostelium fungivorum]|uniref:Protein OSCP1 n=1 Tax=Planoprotostelium fungivorum TaxID=1890364 RepID=A0A2P6NZ28_9EUKA|nr:hypothetical protein PROFUN_01898 [Planoprotostelium fungivorum]